MICDITFTFGNIETDDARDIVAALCEKTPTVGVIESRYDYYDDTDEQLTVEFRVAVGAEAEARQVFEEISAAVPPYGDLLNQAYRTW